MGNAIKYLEKSDVFWHQLRYHFGQLTKPLLRHTLNAWSKLKINKKKEKEKELQAEDPWKWQTVQVEHFFSVGFMFNVYDTISVFRYLKD